MDRIGDALEFGAMWLLLPDDRRQVALCRIQKGILDNLRRDGVRVDGDDVAVFVGAFCIKRPLVVAQALGTADQRWDECQPVASVISAHTFDLWQRERRPHCTILIESTQTGQAAELLVDRLYFPDQVIVEYVRGIVPVWVPPRKFALVPARILGRIGE